MNSSSDVIDIDDPLKAIKFSLDIDKGFVWDFVTSHKGKRQFKIRLLSTDQDIEICSVFFPATEKGVSDAFDFGSKWMNLKPNKSYEDVWKRGFQYDSD